MSTSVTINAVVDDWFANQLEQRQISYKQDSTSTFDLAAAGLLDSFAVVELLVSLSSRHEFDVDEDKLNIDNCRTLTDLKTALAMAARPVA